MGTQAASLAQGVFEAAGRRYVLCWKLLHEVLLVAVVPAGTNVLTAGRVLAAVTQLLLLYCKATTAVTMDKIFRKYVQVHAAVGALVRDNGQDHQRAFLEGESIIGLLRPSTQHGPKLTSLLGLANKDKQHAATRAGDRVLQEALDTHAAGGRTAEQDSFGESAERAEALPEGAAATAAAAAQARAARVITTADGFTRPEAAKAEGSGELAGLAQHVALPGFRMPEQMLPNRLADPEGKLRPGERTGELEEEEAEEEEEEEESEGTADTEAEAEEASAAAAAPQPLPELQEPSDVALVERWRACFVGPRLAAAGMAGHVVCTVPELACFVRLQAPAAPAVVDAIARARAHTASFKPEDGIVAAGHAEAAEHVDTESEYSAEGEVGGGEAVPALRLLARAPRLASGAARPARSVLTYHLPAARMPPPVLACLHVNDVAAPAAEQPTDEAAAAAGGRSAWHVYVRVEVQVSRRLPCGIAGGMLCVRFPDVGLMPARCKPKAAFNEASRTVSFTVPPLASENSFEARIKMKGVCGLLGPECDKVSASLALYSDAAAGTLTGAALERGNAVEEMESSRGQFVCQLELRPVVHRFKRSCQDAED